MVVQEETQPLVVQAVQVAVVESLLNVQLAPIIMVAQEQQVKEMLVEQAFKTH